MKKITSLLIGLFLSVLFAFPVLGAERVLTVGGNAASRPISDFYMGQHEGTFYYVNSAVPASGNCRSLATACKTITEAVAVAVAGDTIYIKGSFSEAVTVAVAGVRIVGIGSTPHRAQWTSATDTKTLTITAADVVVENIRFAPPTYTAGIPASIYLNGATYAVIKNNRFQGKAGSWYAIYTTGDCDNTKIINNEFFYMNTATYGTAIKSSGASDISGMLIEGNVFNSNLNHIVAPMKLSVIKNNVLPGGGLAAAGTYSATLTVLGIDVHGVSDGGYNVVTQNQLGSLYHQACYYPGTGDEWNGNFVKDRTHATQVDATTGISILAPAA
ncbi:MAG: hypothetical protein A2031_07920 [Deltaproteobacteria bacterium RBG_19FT_COMBO_43_11]|nr:MAG: hypothetical protein A2031_07920 [Deltaproteobacteria bacterium RBG_19FT_COMBO_43_11]